MLALALTPLRQTGPSAWPSFSFPGGESSPAHSHHRFAATHSEHRASLFAATATNPEHRASLCVTHREHGDGCRGTGWG